VWNARFTSEHTPKHVRDSFGGCNIDSVKQVRANTADEAFFTLDPLPYEAEDTIVQPGDPWYCNLERHFAPRDYSVIPQIEKHFNAPKALEHEFVHVAVVGHKGTGKTTQVRTAMLNLQPKGVIHGRINALTSLDESDFAFPDVILTIAQTVVDVLLAERVEIPEPQYELVKSWFSEKILTTERSQLLEGEVQAQAEAGSTIPFLAKFLARITATLKSKNEYRTEIRERASSNTDELVRNLNILLDAANAALSQNGQKRTVAVVFDNLEKITNQELIDRAVILQSENLRRLRCHLVFFLDPAAQYAPQSKPASDAFKVIYAPNLHVRDKKDSIDTVHADAFEAIKEVLDKRVNLNQVFDDPDQCVQEIARMSGGRLRDVLAIPRRACEYVPGQRITLSDIQYAAQSLTNERVVMVKEEHWPRLAQINKQKTINPGDGYLLLHSLVLNYNGQQWFDIHPLLVLDPRIQQP
jgi:hypothetical protein